MDEPRESAPIPPAKAHVHLVLPLLYLFFISLPAGFLLAAVNAWRGSSDPAQRRWTAALVGLVVVDALAFLGGMRLYEGRQAYFGPSIKTGVESRLVVGLDFVPGGDARVGVVLPGSPAAEAGLAAGDEILSVDGRGVEGVMDFYLQLGAGEAGRERKLQVQRGTERLDLALAPEARSPAGPRGLFEVAEGSGSEFRPWELLKPFVPALVAGLLVWGVGLWKRVPAVPLWSGFFAATGVSMLIGAGMIWAFGLGAGGLSAGAFLVSILAQHLSLLGLALALRMIWPAPGGDPVEPAGPAVRQGIFYLLCGLPRVAVLALSLQFLLLPGAVPEDPFTALAQSDLGGVNALLFLLPVVVVGPVAEELLFRGFLLPGLRRQFGTATAVFASSAVFALLHPHYSVQMLVIFFFGLVLGWARVRSGGIKAPLLLHMGINAFNAFLLLG